MREWEYKKIALYETPRGRDDIDLLCEAGEAGWELVVVLANNVAYLKRAIEDSVAEATERRSDETREARAAEVGSTASNGGSASHVKPKYRDPVTGETWSGRGRMATWLKRKQDAGEDTEDYLV